MIVGAAPTREEIEESEKEIQKLTNEDAHTVFNTETRTWGLSIGSKRSRARLKNCRRCSKPPDTTRLSMGHQQLPLLRSPRRRVQTVVQLTDFKTCFGVT